MKAYRLIFIKLAIIVLLPGFSGCDKGAEIQLPSVTTRAATEIESSSAKSGGDVSSNDGSEVLARGICWNVTQLPTTSNFKTIEATNTFFSTLSGLEGNTAYYVRAYASNNAGTAYGNEVSFTTLPGEVEIGDQIWMDKNLSTSHFLNGEPIVNVSEASSWTTLGTAAFSDYDNSVSYGATYGHLYNWYAVTDNRKLCPAGWHVSTKADWDQLVNFLGGAFVAGEKMKEAGNSHWNTPNDGTNESGFTALPGGHRFTAGGFFNLKSGGYFWTTAESSSANAEYRNVSSNGPGVSANDIPKFAGLSVRCVKD